MRKIILSFISIFVVGVVALGILTFYSPQTTSSIPLVKTFQPRGPCMDPIEYSIGRFDDEFGISQERFREAIASAEEIWEAHLDRELFVYDQEGDFTIDLVFDERQRRTIAASKTEERLEDIKTSREQYSDRYENVRAVYERERTVYEEDLAEYKKRVNEYNSRVDYWNKRGGAPEKEYRALEEMKAALDEEKKLLEEKRQQINALAKQLNSIAEASNTLAREYNQEARTYTERFGTAHRFNQGEYQGNTIQIYQFEDQDDLRLVIAHELGHALGIDHVDDPRGIMYYLMEGQSIDNIDLTQADISALYEVCGIEKSGVESATTTP